MALHRQDVRPARRLTTAGRLDVVAFLALLWWVGVATGAWWAVAIITVIATAWGVALAWR